MTQSTQPRRRDFKLIKNLSDDSDDMGSGSMAPISDKSPLKTILTQGDLSYKE